MRCPAGEPAKIWKIKPSLTVAWTVEEISFDDPPADNGHVQGMWKRFMYVPSLKSVVWVDNATSPVYGVRVVY